MKISKNIRNFTKIVMLLFAIVYAVKYHQTMAVNAQITVEANDSLINGGNRVLNQVLLNTNPYDADTGYLFAQAAIGKSILASISADIIIGRINFVMRGDWIYYTNTLDGGNLYRMKTDGSDRRKLNNDCSEIGRASCRERV